MASTEGLVPITRAYLSSYYDKYPLIPLSDDIAAISSQLRSLISDFCSQSTLTQDEKVVVDEVDYEPPHKIDENMWKNRENIEEIIYLLDRSQWPATLQHQAVEDPEIAAALDQLKDKFEKSFKTLQYFQTKNADFVFSTVMSYMPQDLRGTLIRQQKERSERNRQAEVDALVKSGCSIRDRYALLWRQQMDRRRQLASLGSATGVYKTLVKYLVGVPQVLLDFIHQINDDEGIEYECPLLQPELSRKVLSQQAHGRAKAATADQLNILKRAANLYTCEFERFIVFIGEVFANSPFFISADEVGASGSRNDEYKEITIPAGKTHEVVLSVDSVNSYIAWDFALEQSKMKMDVGFSVEYTDPSGQNILILPYRRCESDQVRDFLLNLCWFSNLSDGFLLLTIVEFRALYFKVDCIPPVVESSQQ
ncbi:hypothetical protein KSS87_017021 [Heliosperma pusillum]|nr:hypothetical protein KSS87_017021 [Heliosperma pusillum]